MNYMHSVHYLKIFSKLRVSWREKGARLDGTNNFVSSITIGLLYVSRTKRFFFSRLFENVYAL